MTYAIIKGAPVPPVRGGPYHFKDMEVGDSFSAPDDMGYTEVGASRRRTSITGSAWYYVKQHNPGWQFTTRKVGDNIQCWRVK